MDVIVDGLEALSEVACRILWLGFGRNKLNRARKKPAGRLRVQVVKVLCL